MPEMDLADDGPGAGQLTFPPIADYAFLSDCETTALVAPDGGVEWLCLPRADSASVFATVLDRSAGFFRFGPAHVTVPAQRRYVPGSMVLETTWCTSSGWLIVRDALVMGPWTGAARVPGHRRPPGDSAARCMLVRTATCIAGQIDLSLLCMPLFDYGRSSGNWSYAGAGYGAARCVADGQPPVTLTTSLRLGLGGSRATARAGLREGETAFAALSWGDVVVDSAVDAVAEIDTTVQGWRDWARHAKLPDHPWRPYLERSALTLKGLSYAPSGAIMAAATTSLPETPGGARNWDYRYTWIRDSAFMLSALFELGFDWEAFSYFAFIMDAVAAGPLQIMYGIDAERELDEEVLDHLTGYDGARPVRIGNGAFSQRQHDVWGMAMESVSLHFDKAAEIGPVAWKMVTKLVESALAVWHEPDRGIWEVRGEPRHFTASKVMCWVAADRGARLAAGRGDRALAKRWRAAADEIRADVESKGVDDRGVFVQYYGATGLDASALLIPLMGFLPPGDERVRATVLAIADELTSDGLVLRYQAGQTDDGLEGDEGTFTICSFWLVSALAMIGEVDRATALCGKLLSLASPLHLYAEEIDAASGRHLGNFPQAFTHLALIDAVLRVIDATADAGTGVR
ncbi:MAG TPA: glycoside hydrolase family 15 protein [Streptosporangiaceae bacterium]|jgi:GH15 family glucan-1,4-alpha-glucosidase